MNKSTLIGMVVALAVISVGGMWLSTSNDSATPIVSSTALGTDDASAEGAIIVPEFTQTAQSGEIAFNENCAACHGKNAAGTDQGPPLIHRIYKPNHHGDFAIQMAAQNGVRAHHWRFGDMPPVEGITETKIRWITKYIREIQVANGIN